MELDRRPAPAAPPAPTARRHLLYDLWVDAPETLRWAPPLRRLLVEAARQCGATVLADRFHQFEPHGVTGILLLAESHVSIHTWPEEGLATLDVFTCGTMDAEGIIEAVRTALRPSKERLTTVARGAGSGERGAGSGKVLDS